MDATIEYHLEVGRQQALRVSAVRHMLPPLIVFSAPSDIPSQCEHWWMVRVGALYHPGPIPTVRGRRRD